MCRPDEHPNVLACKRHRHRHRHTHTPSQVFGAMLTALPRAMTGPGSAAFPGLAALVNGTDGDGGSVGGGGDGGGGGGEGWLARHLGPYTAAYFGAPPEVRTCTHMRIDTQAHDPQVQTVHTTHRHLPIAVHTPISNRRPRSLYHCLPCQGGDEGGEAGGECEQTVEWAMRLAYMVAYAPVGGMEETALLAVVRENAAGIYSQTSAQHL